ncbi:sugar phosphate isomerase/epimerase [Novosphingobium sp. AP12]|uniref:sugar phosphate isomerase/epimerase family protein n=1 Tax=Novosphingobium sp. AP12 TaxID=1144305 RepID=UPI000271FB41|nr:TIM barrel protein [Novosphingobium sp. AP12]EJL28744.1 sugar phosphate isomerase/epimerase [Novosphingobium sp. AP12]
MDRLAIEFISVLGLPPVEFVKLAADLGVGHIGLAPKPITANPHGYPAWDLLADTALRRETLAAMADTAVQVSLGEGFLIRDGLDADAFAPMLDLFAELGAPLVNAVNMVASAEPFGRFAEMARTRGMVATVEFLPLMPPASFAKALAFTDACGSDNARVLVDAMHFFRGGSGVEELTGIDPSRIGYVQICDVPMPARMTDYGLEARENRLGPGEGDLPLADFIAAIPADVIVGLEVPQVGRAQDAGPAERLAPMIAIARALLN